MKNKILEALKNGSDYISGQELCETLKVSRTAIWKNINALKNEGYVIDAISNRGYRLISSPDIVTEVSIKSELNTKWIGKTVECHKEISSTNVRAKQLGEESGLEGTIILAEEQLAGRGRRGREWISPPGKDIWMSLLLRPNLPAINASMLTIVAALAVARGIDTVTSLNTQIKWPNDIIIHGKKVCGILTEMSTDMEYINYVVVGIGINVNNRDFPIEIREKATSLGIETSRDINRSILVGEICRRFEIYYDLFMEKKDLSLLIEEYNSSLVNRDREVIIIEEDKECIKTAMGIDEQGALLVRDNQGSIERIISGEVSVRGLYGYI